MARGMGTPESPISNGYSECCVIDIKDFPKYADRIEFVSYKHYGGMVGQSMYYKFTAWVEQEKEEE